MAAGALCLCVSHNPSEFLACLSPSGTGAGEPYCRPVTVLAWSGRSAACWPQLLTQLRQSQGQRFLCSHPLLLGPVVRFVFSQVTVASPDCTFFIPTKSGVMVA